ncbi:MAG: porin, partial [Sphingomonadales bacterium]
MNFKFKYLWSGLTMFLLVMMGQPVFGQAEEQSSSQEKEQTPSNPPADTLKEEDSLQSRRVLGNVPGFKRFTVTWKPAPAVASRNGKFEIQLHGRVYWDYAVIKNSDRTIDINSSTFRAARIGFFGRYGKKFFFRIELDFAENTTVYKDLYVEWRGWADIKFGYHRFASPMERASGLAVLPFMERAALYAAFNLGRKAGISLAKTDELGMFEIGFGRGLGDDSIVSSPSNTIAARVNRAIPIEDGYVHLAGSITAQEIQENNEEFLFSAQPFQRQAPVLINTGEIANKTIFFGLEGGVFKGPFSLVGEVGFQKTTLTSPLP